MQNPLIKQLIPLIKGISGCEPDQPALTSVSGGCIHKAFKFTSKNLGLYFVKCSSKEDSKLLRTEFESLSKIALTKAIKVPQALHFESNDKHAFLIMEWLEIGQSTSSGYREMGKQLARMHRFLGPQFGWHEANFIGMTPQINNWQEDWISFLINCRLKPQWELAVRNGLNEHRWGQLTDKIPALFSDYRPEPSLLHGDLWGGNAAIATTGEPVIFDPASYYGDRETDIAFTRFFGGFPGEFYQAYEKEYPLHYNSASRTDLYNLYHALNHFNLFGKTYLSSIRNLLDRIL